MRRLRCRTRLLSTYHYIISSWLEFTSNIRREYTVNDATGVSQRDMTTQLYEIERAVFYLSSRLFLDPLTKVVTLDDDFTGSREADLPVKTLSPRKSQNKGHMADVIADSIFNSFIAVRFRRKDEGQETRA